MDGLPVLPKDTPKLRHIRRKRSLGYCGYVGCHVIAVVGYYCTKHRRYMSKAVRESYYRKLGKPVPETTREYKKIA